MSDANTPSVRDLVSVGTRVSWGAIFAGAILALAISLLCATLGAAVGLSVHDRVAVDNLKTGTMAWAYISTFVALFVGGLVTSLLTVGENKAEAILHGILMWALLLGILLTLGASGVKLGIDMVGLANQVDVRPITPDVQVQSSASQDAAKRFAWYTFAGIWLSMIAAAAGAFAGAGPTFRVVAKPKTTVRVSG
jgi:hypothetical protein